MLRTRRPVAARALLPTLLSALFVAPFVFAPSDAQAQAVQLRYNFQPGSEQRYEILQTSSIELPGMGAMNQNQRQVVFQEVLSVDSEGNARIRTTVESLRMEMDSPMGRQVFDSEDEEAIVDPELQALGAMVGVASEIEIGPDGSLVDGADFAAVLEGMLDEMEPEARALLGDILSEEVVEGMVRQAFQLFPRDPIAPGEGWDHSISMPMVFGTLTSSSRYTLERIEERDGRRVAVVSFEGTIGEFEADADNPMAAMMQLDGGDLSGSFDYDLERALFLETVVVTTMEIGVMGQTMRSTTQVETRPVG